VKFLKLFWKKGSVCGAVTFSTVQKIRFVLKYEEQELGWVYLKTGKRRDVD
jgi:hypothetical protein